MPYTTQQGRIVETAREARQGERGPTMLLVLTIGTVAAIVILGGLWMMFF
jgi:hypothetical protein